MADARRALPVAPFLTKAGFFLIIPAGRCSEGVKPNTSPGTQIEKEPGSFHPALQAPETDESRLVPERVDPLSVALNGLHLQAHLLAQFAADESSHTVSLPPGRSHDYLQTSPGGLLQ